MALGCMANPMRSLDLSNCPNLPLDSITARGSGYIGYFSNHDYSSGANNLYVFASPEEGEQFEGFYDQADAFISNGTWYSLYNAYYHYYSDAPTDITAVCAHFTGSTVLPGDADGNGSVTVADAVLAMRCAMQLIGTDALNLANADIDGNGAVTIADAVAILRLAIGIA